MGTSNRMSGERRREQILEVARDAFRRRGYRATTLDVAEAAGVSETLVIKHFGSKEELFRAAVAQPLFDLLERTIADNREQVASHQTPALADHRARLTAWAEAWTAFIGDEQALLLSLLREAHEFPDLTGQLFDMLRTLMDDVATTVKQLADGDGYVDFDARVATYATVGALTAAVAMGADLPSFIDEYLEMLLFGILSLTGRAELGR